MPSRKVKLTNNCFYHIFNRTLDGRQLFYSNSDYIAYLKLWKEVDFTTCVRILAYCLMPNHFHYLFLITDETLFPRKISYFFNKYLTRLNALRNESGNFFKGRYQAKLVKDLQYLISLCGYIHLNPVEAGIVNVPEKWVFSNYLEFIGKRNGTLFDVELFDEYIKSSDYYVEYLKTRYSSDSLGPFLFDED